jgi:hypothetical protein
MVAANAACSASVTAAGAGADMHLDGLAFVEFSRRLRLGRCREKAAASPMASADRSNAPKKGKIVETIGSQRVIFPTLQPEVRQTDSCIFTLAPVIVMGH